MKRKGKRKSGGRGGKYHASDWSWKEYVGDSCLRPWYVCGVLQTPLPPQFVQRLLRVTASLKECQECTFSLSGHMWWSLSPLQEQQDRDLESHGGSGHVLWLLYRGATPLTAEDPLWLVTVCERGIKLSKSMAERSTQLRTFDGLAQLCVVALRCFFHLYWKGAHMPCSEQKLDSVFTSLAHCFSWHLLLFIWAQLLLAQEITSVLRLHCRKQNNTRSHQRVRSAEPSPPPAPAPRTDAVSCPLLQVTMSPIPGSPKARLKFLAGGLGGPRNRPSACSGSSTSCLPSADLPCPSASALSSWPCGIIPAVPSPGEGLSAAALVSRVTVRGKKKIPLRWLAFVESSKQYPGHPAEVPVEKHVNSLCANHPQAATLPPQHAQLPSFPARRALLCP